MPGKNSRPAALRLAAIAAIALPLAACSMAGLSTHGNNQLQVAELSNANAYTAQNALVAARGHFRNNDFGKSASLYKRLVDLEPQSAEGYIGLGASYDRLRRFDLSDRVYASLYAITGSTAQYHNNLGYSFLLRGKLADALRQFRKAQQLAPGNVVIANNIELVARASATTRI